LPSFAEGFPIALLEAMASYLPVVSTKVGGIPDMIHKENGILITPGNSSELAEAIIKLLNSEDLCAEMGNNNRMRVEKYYTIENMIEKISSLYFQLLNKK
jgi:glycosyltransferase involved in cell wall biosynthesis